MWSPTHALLWEIWRRHRDAVAAIVGLTVTGRLLSDQAVAVPGGSADPGPLVELLWMGSFLLLFGIFNYTESSDGRAVGRFPQRLFLLPVSSLRLVAVPMLIASVAVELLYLLWTVPLSRGGSTPALLVGVLLAATMVCYQAALWTLGRLGPLRLIVVGAVAIMAFGIGLLPSFPPSPPSPWRSEGALTAMVAGVAVAIFLLSWRHVARLRCGGTRRVHRLEPDSASGASAGAAMLGRRSAFGSPAAAHFWYEWRCSGLVLPLLVGGVLLVIIAPLSWSGRHDANETVRFLLATLATPIVLAIPVGMAFSKPAFWSEEMSVPEFVAVRPLSAEELVATKVRVAIATVALSWLVALSFVGAWLSLWGHAEVLSRWGLAGLVVIAGMFLTWRFLVSGLWTGLSGSRPRFVASVVTIVVVAIAGGVFDATRLPGWLLEEPARLASVAWTMAAAVVAKYWLAARAWRGVTPRYRRLYLRVWLSGTTCFVTLGVAILRVARIGVPRDLALTQSVVILLALLLVPLARVGAAPSSLARNLHR